MDTKIMRTCDDSVMIIVDEVCIEEDEAVKEMREIYKTVDCIKKQAFKRGDNSLDEAIKKICSTENMPQNIRRSERIQMKLIQKECYLASQPLTYEPTLNETTTFQKQSSKRKQKSLQNGAPSSLGGPVSQSSNKKHCVKVPERVEGIVFRDGKEYIVVKWKSQKPVELISTKDLTDNLKKLAVSFLHSRLLTLSGNENTSQEKDHASLRGNSVFHETEDHVPIVRENSVCQGREECMPATIKDSVYQEREEQALCENKEDYYSVSQADECHSNCTVKNAIPIDVPSLHLQKINTLNFKRQQKLFIEESGILDEYNASSMDIKMAI